MKTLIITLLALLSLSSYAMTYDNSMAQYLLASYTPTTVDDNDTTKIMIAESEIIIIDTDSTMNVTIIDSSMLIDGTASSTEEYKDVNVEVLEGENSTRIIVHRDGDTIKSYEMNFDFQSEGNTNSFEQSEYGTKSNNIEDENSINDKSFTFPKKNKNRFRGHWSGFEFGLNNYVTNDFSMTPEDSYMEINTGKSWNFNLNFAQLSVPIIRDRLGLITGMGIEWNNYHFSNKNTITKNEEPPYTITPKDLSDVALKKNRLQTTYLTAPILLEVQLGSGPRDERIAISAGLIGGLKIGSHTKVKTSEGKQKVKDDFYLQSFRYGFTARVNYNAVGLYFNYYNVPLFVDGKGPELYPFAAGIVLSFD